MFTPGKSNMSQYFGIFTDCEKAAMCNADFRNFKVTLFEKITFFIRKLFDPGGFFT